MFKHGIKIFILIAWLSLMGWWWAESRTWPAPEKIDVAFLPDYNDYYSLRYNEQKIGWSYRSLRRLPGGEYQASQNTTIKVILGGEELEVKSGVIINTDQSLNLQDYSYVLQAGPLTATESGEVAGGRLSIDVNLGPYGPLLEQFLADYGQYLGGYASQFDFSREVVINPPDGPGLSQMMPSYLSYLGLEAGRNYSFKVIDPAGRRLTTMPIRIAEEGREYELEVGREVPAYRLIMGGETGGGTEMWVDRFGRVFRESALGFSSRREDSQLSAMDGLEPLFPPAALQRLINIESLTRIIDQVKGKREAEAEEAAEALRNQINERNLHD